MTQVVRGAVGPPLPSDPKNAIEASLFRERVLRCRNGRSSPTTAAQRWAFDVATMADSDDEGENKGARVSTRKVRDSRACSRDPLSIGGVVGPTYQYRIVSGWPCCGGVGGHESSRETS